MLCIEKVMDSNYKADLAQELYIERVLDLDYKVDLAQSCALRK